MGREKQMSYTPPWHTLNKYVRPATARPTSPLTSQLICAQAGGGMVNT